MSDLPRVPSLRRPPAPWLAWVWPEPPAQPAPARRVHEAWRWPTLLALIATVPAFYEELVDPAHAWVGQAVYLVAAAVLMAALLHTLSLGGRRRDGLRARRFDLALVAGLLVAAALPPSHVTVWTLAARMLVAAATLLRMVAALRGFFNPSGLPRLLTLGTALFAACGVGYWWLEPSTPTFGDGLWLAFVTAATVGYGDVVPTTPAAKIFSVFVVLLGWGMLSVVTAAIAARWVGTEGREIEGEILRDLHREVGSLRDDVAVLRRELQEARNGERDSR